MSTHAYERVDEAARAHSNLNTFGAIIAILEGGCVYGGGTEAATAQKIIALCRAEQQRQLSRFDKASQRAQWLAAKTTPQGAADHGR